MQQPADQVDQARDWRVNQGPLLIELMHVITNAGQAIVMADGDRLEQLLGRWRSALRVAQSPVSVGGVLSAAGAGQ